MDEALTGEDGPPLFTMTGDVPRHRRVRFGYSWRMRCATIAAVFLVPAFAAARPAEHGFDAPLYVHRAKVGMSADTDPPAPIVQTCLVFQRFAVITVQDPAIKGGTVRVRPRGEGSSEKELCAPGGEGKLLGESLGSGWGASGDFVFVEEDDAFGIFRNFMVFRASTGERVLEDAFDEDQPFLVKDGAIRFHRPLEMSCVPGKRDPGCWAQMLKKYAIPAELKLVAPNCAKAVRADPKVKGEALQISVPVRIALENPASVTFLPGEARCALAP